MGKTGCRVSAIVHNEHICPFLSPEDLAVALDDGNARRNWFLNLYVENQVALIERSVNRVLSQYEILDGMYRPAMVREGRKA